VAAIFISFAFTGRKKEDAAPAARLLPRRLRRVMRRIALVMQPKYGIASRTISPR
jgi:hypothetical protein